MMITCQFPLKKIHSLVLHLLNKFDLFIETMCILFVDNKLPYCFIRNKNK